MTSVLLPTIRPWNIKGTLESLLSGSFDDMEVVVVADFKPDFIVPSQVKWVYDDCRDGTISAINRAYSEANGEYYFVTNDETVISGKDIGVMEERFRNRLVIGSSNRDGTLTSYGKFIAEFPFISRKTLDVLCDGKYLFDPIYKSFWADPDLSLRAYVAGIPVEFCPNTFLVHRNDEQAEGHQVNKKLYYQRDSDIFHKRWDYMDQ